MWGRAVPSCGLHWMHSSQGAPTHRRRQLPYTRLQPAAAAPAAYARLLSQWRRQRHATRRRVRPPLSPLPAHLLQRVLRQLVERVLQLLVQARARRTPAHERARRRRLLWARLVPSLALLPLAVARRQRPVVQARAAARRLGAAAAIPRAWSLCTRSCSARSARSWLCARTRWAAPTRTCARSARDLRARVSACACGVGVGVCFVRDFVFVCV